MLLWLKKRISCKHCQSKKTLRKGSRNGLKRFFCKDCKRGFSINHKQKQLLFPDYVDGLSLRHIGLRQNKSFKQIDNIIRKELDNIVENTFLTHTYINPAKYCGVLCMDAKYVKVRGYETKIPFLYCIDYYSHDIVCGFLCVSENREAFRKMFRLLKTVKYPLKYLIIDDVIEKALLPLKYYYPRARIQLCSTHFLRNTKELLRIATKETNNSYDDFLKDFSLFLRTKISFQKKERSIKYFLRTYGMDSHLESLLFLVIEKKEFLFLFCKTKKDIPHTNNLIESFNSHLEGRLKTIKGFRSFLSAERFLNAWMVRRRTKEFVSCSKKFKYLNKKTSLGMCLKQEYSLEKVIKKIYGN